MTHYGFLNSYGNDPMHNQFTAILSSTSYGGDSHHIMGRGAYVYGNNMRRCAALFSVRSLVKLNWINSNDAYLKPASSTAQK